MKKFKLFLLIGGITSFVLLATSLVIPVLILSLSWWWFSGTLIGFAVIWVTIGLIFLIKKLTSRLPEQVKIDPKTAVKHAINYIKYESENPDNFRIEYKELERHGRDPMTPILIIYGKGTEKQEKIVVLINLNNPEKEMMDLRNPTEQQVRRSAELMAENPEQQITESIQRGYKFGMPEETIQRSIPSSQKKRDEEEKKELDKKQEL